MSQRTPKTPGRWVEIHTRTRSMQKTKTIEISDCMNKWFGGIESTYCEFRMQRWCTMRISQSPRQFCFYSRWRFCEATTCERSKVWTFKIIENRRTCEGRSAKKRPRGLSKQISSADKSSFAALPQTRWLTSPKITNSFPRHVLSAQA